MNRHFVPLFDHEYKVFFRTYIRRMLRSLARIRGFSTANGNVVPGTTEHLRCLPLFPFHQNTALGFASHLYTSHVHLNK